MHHYFLLAQRLGLHLWEVLDLPLQWVLLELQFLDDQAKGEHEKEKSEAFIREAEERAASYRKRP
jgi:hypothetical protein